MIVKQYGFWTIFHFLSALSIVFYADWFYKQASLLFFSKIIDDANQLRDNKKIN